MLVYAALTVLLLLLLAAAAGAALYAAERHSARRAALHGVTRKDRFFFHFLDTRRQEYGEGEGDGTYEWYTDEYGVRRKRRVS